MENTKISSKEKTKKKYDQEIFLFGVLLVIWLFILKHIVLVQVCHQK